MNSNEVDQITGETSALAHKITQVIGVWRMTNPKATRVPRSIRREINQTIKADNRARELEHAQERAQFEQRLITYRWHQERDRGVYSWDTQATWFDRQQALAVEHERLQTSIYAAQQLTATERGAASRALDRTHRNPHVPVKPVFGPKYGLDALKARARDSYTRVRSGLADRAEQRRVAYWQKLQRQRAQQPDRTVIGYIPLSQIFEPQHNRTGPAMPVPEQARSDRAAYVTQPRPTQQANPTHTGIGGKLTREQADAIQGLRAAQLTWNIESVDASEPEREQLAEDWRNAARAAERTGLTTERVEWEFRNAERNSAFTSVMEYSTGSNGQEQIVQAFHPTKTEAANWVTQQVVEAPKNPEVRLYARIHQRGQNAPAYLTTGGITEVTEEVQRWGNPQHERTEPSATNQEQTYQVTVGTTEFLREHPELAQRHEVPSLADGYRLAAERLADDRQGWPDGAEVTVEIHRNNQEAPVYSAHGQRGTVSNEINSQREQQHRNSPTDLDQLRVELDTAQQENTDLAHQLSALQAERDQFRAERDQAVRKLIERTPTEHRFGSPERQAQQASKPASPQMPQPIFSGPVLPQPVIDGMDR